MICFILLWLGVGNVLSIWLPSRDEPIRQRRQSGSLKQFLIAFTVAYLIGYLVNFMLVWRMYAAQALTARLGTAIIPAILIVLSCISMWILLTVFAVALAQQPKVTGHCRRRSPTTRPTRRPAPSPRNRRPRQQPR